jgi:hypothetical protein
LVKRFWSPFSKSHGCSCVIWREAIFVAKWGQNLELTKSESVVYSTCLTRYSYSLLCMYCFVHECIFIYPMQVTLLLKTSKIWDLPRSFLQILRLFFFIKMGKCNKFAFFKGVYRIHFSKKN